MPLPTAQGAGGLNPMSFTENQHGNGVLERLRQQRESGRFCDVFLVVRDRQFSAHRNILAACSPYFDSILKMHKVVKEQVTVNCQNPDVFELLLNYMYSGSVVIDRGSVMELLKLSNNFLVTKLKNYCAEYLDRYLDAANCITVKELASKYNMPGLLKNACEFLEVNINRCLLDSNDILDYSLVQVKQLLADPNYRLTIAPDIYLRFIARWVGRKVTERESLFKELLSGAPLSQVGRETFVQLLDFEPLFANSETARFALLQSMYENSIPLSKYEGQYQALLAKHSGEVNIYFNDTTNGMDVSIEDGGEGGVGALHASPVRVEPLTDNQRHHQHPHQPAPFASALPIEALAPTSSASSASTENSSHHSAPPSAPRDPMSYIPMVMPIVKQELTETAPTPVPVGNRMEFEPSVDSTAPRDQPPVLGGPTTLEATILNSENVAPPSDQMDSNRPALKLTLRLPLLNRKNRLLGKHKQYRKSVTTANQTLLNKRRGRPPKFRARIRTGMDSPFYPDCGINLDESVDDFGDEEDDGALVVDEGNGDEAGTSNVGGDGATAEIAFRCPNCIYTANTQSRITAHIARAHSRNVIFVCSVCQYECKWNREYYTHMKSHFNGPPFNCDACEYTADRIQMLLTHRMKHTDERPFKCTQCEYRCRTKTNLLAHMRSHTGEKPFSCTECGRGFAIKSTLDQHLATHSDTRPFRCDQCNFSTKYQSHLISHKRIHTGDVFHCQFHECNYSSPKKSQLAAHLRTHLAVRAHTCKICNRSFIEKSHLVRHERIHLAEKPFKCEHCDYASSRRDKLKEHIQKHHGAAASNKQHRRRYRRAKQLAQLAAQAKNQLPPAAGDSSMLPAADADHVFRPIAPAAVSRASSHELLMDQQPPQRGQGQTQMQQQQQQQQQLDMNHLLGSPSPLLNRPSSAFLPHASFTQGNPSPALSLNFNLGGYDTPVVPGKDVVLGGQMAPTPTIDSLVTPDPTPRSPMSTNSLQTEPLPNSHTPTADLQRPMSLPPALGGQPGAQWPQNQDFSFTAMF